jgi:DNA-binding transcriptional MerR regulator
MRLKRTYSSREIASLTGLTARQLQLWDANGLMAAAIPTHRTETGGYTERRYTPIELFELLVLADLRRRGFSVHQLHQILATLREQFGVRLFDATGGSGRIQLLTDGHEIYARTERGEFFNLLKEPAQPLLVVGDEGLLKALSSTLRPGRGRKAARRRRARASGSEKSLPGRRPDAE